MYKVLIADDEKTECKALEMMIKNGMKNCEVLDSVYNGIELLKAVEEKQPDIAIIDINMPGIRGLDAIEIIRAKNRTMKIIINTAYSDFEYIKRAMKFQVFDYMLKPIKREDLYSILNNICRLLDEERTLYQTNSKVNEIENQIADIAKDHFLTSLLLGQTDLKSFDIFLNTLNVEYHGGIIIFIKIVNPPEKPEELLSLLDQIRGIVDMELSRSMEFIVKYYDFGLYYYLVPGIVKEEFENWFLKELEILNEKLTDQFNIHWKVSVSLWKSNPKELPQALEECRMVSKNHEEPGIYFFSSEKPTRNHFYTEKLSKMRQLFATKEEAQLLQEFSRSIDYAKKHQFLFEEFKVDTILCLMELFYDGENQSLNLYFLQKINWDEWFETDNYESLRQKIIQMFPPSHMYTYDMNQNKYIFLALNYIAKNYFEDLSLEIVSQNVGITQFYLSRLFRQELHMTFIEILTNIRMGKAFQFLGMEEYSLKLISEKTGFTSLSYFYKVFKRHFGITAGEMRALLQG